jgi:hypothetical protein
VTRWLADRRSAAARPEIPDPMTAVFMMRFPVGA